MAEDNLHILFKGSHAAQVISSPLRNALQRMDDTYYALRHMTPTKCGKLLEELEVACAEPSLELVGASGLAWEPRLGKPRYFWRT